MILRQIYKDKIEKVWYNSSNIYYSELQDHDDSLKTLYIIFKGGDMYCYKDVNVNDYVMFKQGGLDGSQGKAFFKYIKNVYKETCSKIGKIDLDDYQIPIENSEENDGIIVNNVDNQYVSLLANIIENGVMKEDRTGTGTKSIFGTHLKFNLREGLPVLTGKKMALKSITHELLWFLKGDTNIKYLVDNNVSIWNDDAYRFYCNEANKNNVLNIIEKHEFIEFIKKHSFIELQLINPFTLQRIDCNNNVITKASYVLGDLGPIYGRQWRNFNGVDQIEQLINTLKNNPDDRRLIISAWNPADLKDMALPPCHLLLQFYTNINGNGGRELSCSWYQRSVDTFLGLPFNITSYAILTHIIAKLCNMEVGDLIFNGGDTHVYLNHLDVVNEYINRVEEKVYSLPNIYITDIQNIDEIKFENITIENYKSYPQLKAELSVGV